MNVRRPLVWVTVALMTGAASASLFGPPFSFFLVAFPAAWVLTVVCIVNKWRMPATALALITSFLLGSGTYLLKEYVARIPDQLAREYASNGKVEARLFGIVSTVRPSAEGERVTFTLDVKGVETGATRADVSGRTLVNWYEAAGSVKPGDAVEVAGKLSLLKGFKNPHTFDYERHMYRRKIFTRMYAKGADAVVVKSEGNFRSFVGWRESFRRKGLEVISRSTRTDEARAFVAAILLGERGLLTREMEDWFKKTGTFHVLAISGLHVGLVYLIASLALSPFPLGPKVRISLAMLFVWVYAIAAGASIPTVRAAIMLTLVLAEYYVAREGDFLTAIAFAALCLMAFDPTVIDEASFQLSFTAVLLLATFQPIFSNRVYPALQQRLAPIPSSILHKLALNVYASLVVGVGMFPLIAYHFNLVSMTFLGANLIVVPMLSLVLASGIACLLVGFVWVKAALLFGLITELFAWIIFAIVKLCSMPTASSLRISSPPIWVLGLGAFAIMLAWWRASLSRKTLAFAALLALCVATAFTGSRFSGHLLRLTFLDVGDADSCFVEFPNGENMLVDAGFTTPNLDCGEQLIVPFLWRKRIRKVDTLVLTHPDMDHTGGAMFIMKNFRVGRLVLADSAETLAEFSQILNIAQERGLPVATVKAGDVLADNGKVHVEVLSPPQNASEVSLPVNENSLALRIAYGDTNFLLTGDAEKRALRFLSNYGEKLKSTVLKAPHHGLASGFNKTFVESVMPELVVISGSVYRANDHMEHRVLRYMPLCKSVLSTQTSGAVIVESDGRLVRTIAARNLPLVLF